MAKRDTGPMKERKPIPRPGVRFTDRKKERDRRAARGRRHEHDA